MPKAKTKKRIFKKKIKKLPARKIKKGLKSGLSSLKKKSAKKHPPAKKFLMAKAQNQTLAKSAQSAPLLFNSPKLEIQNEYVANIKKSTISPHILDLKKIQAEKLTALSAENNQASIISHELLAKFAQQKNRLVKKIQQTAKPRPVFSTKPAKKKFQLPQIKLPAINWPKLNLQKLQFPTIELPKIKLSLPKLPPISFRIGNFSLPAAWLKTISSFIVICIIFILPFGLYTYYQKLQGKKNMVLGKTAEALSHLTISQKAASAQDFYYTQYELEQAGNNFTQAKNELSSINLLAQAAIKLIPPINKQFATAQKLIEVGEKLSKNGAIITKTIDQLNLRDNPDSLSDLNLTKKIISLKNSLNAIIPDIKTSINDLNQINLSEIPMEYQDKIVKLQSALPVLETNIQTFISSSDLLLNLLGQDQKKRYLLLFQNNNEIRPTGGFIGSFAIADIEQGNFTKIDIPGGGPYDLKAGLEVSIESPRPLHIMNPRWEFQDANWFADLPTSAEKLIWFYEKSGGTTIDGLIFINASFIEKILDLTGPIELTAYNKIITAQNFYQEIQKSVEVEYDKSLNKPKQIIADLTPKLFNSLMQTNKENFSGVLNLLLTALDEKEIQFYFNNYNLEKPILDHNWGGQLKDSDKDYLAIISTNIAGEKSDAKIVQHAELNIDIQNDGSIINTLTITKKHTGLAGENFYGVPNIDYLRIYVPRDSQLLSAEGFDIMDPELFTVLNPEIYQKDQQINLLETEKQIEPQSQTEIYSENNKTVFANWLKVEPGEEKTVTIKYKLPLSLNLEKITDNNYLNFIKEKLNLSSQQQLEFYSLLWQKQAGKRNFDFKVKVTFPTALNFQKYYPGNINKTSNSFTYDDQLNTDKIMAIIYSL
jgi:hypothetical protein